MMPVRLLLVLVAIASAVAPVLAGDEQDCFQGQDPELRIKGCTQVIERAPNDTTGYHNRAFAYSLARDIDKAIADYTKVIEIAPDNASAYANRSRAYASIGDYAQAAADKTRAQELMAKAIAQPTIVTRTGDFLPSESQAAKSPPKATPTRNAKPPLPPLKAVPPLKAEPPLKTEPVLKAEPPLKAEPVLEDGAGPEGEQQRRRGRVPHRLLVMAQPAWRQERPAPEAAPALKVEPAPKVEPPEGGAVPKRSRSRTTASAGKRPPIPLWHGSNS